MKAEFYDVKDRKKVEVEVAFKKKTDKGRCMVYGKTADGRALPKFIKEAEYDTTYKAVAEEGKAAAKPACKKCCKKK